MIVLDSDVVIDILRGLPPALAWFSGLPPDQSIVVPGFVAMEVLWGARDSSDQRMTEKWLAACKTVWLEPNLCEEALRRLAEVHLSNAIGVLDALIAQVAISLDSPLHTFNPKHFSILPELQTIRPYVR